MICQWVSRAICWLSQTAGDYNYPGTGEGDWVGGERGSVEQTPFTPLRGRGPQPAASQLHVYNFILNVAFKFVHTWSVLRL